MDGYWYGGDKDVSAILELLKSASYIFCQPDIPRALSVNDLFNDSSIFLKVNKNPLDALVEARKQAKQNDLIFVGGGTFVVAEIL